MQRTNYQRGLEGAALLTIAAVIAKILSASYRIPLENLVGDLGFYVYQQIYPIYGILVTFALSGFPVYLAQMFSRYAGQDRHVVVRRAFGALSFISGLTFISLEALQGPLATLMGDAKLAPLIGSVAMMVLLMPLLAVGRGFYQADFEMRPTAISQVTEQIVRVTVIIVVAYLATTQHWSVYLMGTLAMTSSTAGALVGSLNFVGFAKRELLPRPKAAAANLPTWVQLAKGLMSEGLLLCLFAALLIVLQLIDSFTVKNGLQQAGLPALTAKLIKGNYDRAQPLVSLGLVLATSFAASLLPALTSAVQRHHQASVKETTHTIMRLTWVMATIAAVGMISIMPALNTLIFGNSQLSAVLSVYVLSIVFASVLWAQNAILQSYLRPRLALVPLAVTVVVKLALNQWAVVTLGIMGASIITTLSLALGAVVMHWQLTRKVTPFVALPLSFVLRLGGVAAAVAISVSGWCYVLQQWTKLTRSFAAVECVSAIGLGVVVFLLSARAVRLLKKTEWLALPAGRILLKVLRYD